MATGNPKTKWNGNQAMTSQDRSTPSPVTLAYEGKQAEHDILRHNPAELVELWSHPASATNHLYYGDNLGILAAITQKPNIYGKVKLIYIDPPFATKSVFHSRSQDNAYQDLLSGSSYIEFLRQRLIFLRELLSEDGSIYVHLDENMAFHIKIIMDEVFGIQNYRNWITRRKCSHKNYTKKTFGNISDYILFYTKTGNYTWHRPVEEWTTERAAKEYTHIEELTGRRYKKVPIHAPGTRNGETGQPWRGILPPPGKHWQYTPKTLDEMDSRGEIYWSPTGNPRRKIYLDQSKGVPIQDIWYDVRDTRNQNIQITGYPTEKNPDLLKRIILASSNPGDLVLDCFCGSGTTLSVANSLGRHWIGIDNSSEALTATIRRLTRGTEPMGDFVSRPNTQVTWSEAQEVQLGLFAELEDPEKVSSPGQSHNFSLYRDLCCNLESADLRLWLQFLNT